ncbi:MAG TPA: AbrB family transcriptional regulator [Cyanobacteria bacterium UBA11369]|nr:AbrB family transcriptional regulator [Cyanobacteria bacterium UBA11371]HBE49778.1 AbrB family transcriptional regulator [Cyanobacteria bacterium UBA11369]
MNKSLSAKHLIAIVVLELLLAIPLGIAITKLSIGGVAWLFGGIASGALVYKSYQIFYGITPKPNKKARQIGQTLVGLSIGFAIASSNLAAITTQLPVLVFLTFFSLVTGTFIGYLYSQISKVNLFNAMLATAPGGVGIMSSIAADYGRNVSQVALVQSLRVTTVVLTIPFVARLLSGDSMGASVGISPSLFNIDIQGLPLLVLALAIASLGVRVATLLKIPAAPFFGALIVGIIFNPMLNTLPFVTDLDFTPPKLVNLIGQVLLGVAVGEHWGNQPYLSKKAVGYALIPVGLIIGAGLIAAAIAHQLTSWDWLTCILVTAPGGAPEMILVSLALDRNVEIVTAGHLVRLMGLNASLPAWIFLIDYLERRLWGANTSKNAGERVTP